MSVGVRTLVGGAVGWLVPILSRVVIQFRYTQHGLWGALISAASDLFRPGYNLFFVGLLNAMPFVLVVALSQGARRALPRVHDDPGHRILVALLYGVLLLGTALTSAAVWRDVYGPGRPSSTAVIALVLVPIYATVAACGVYLAGVVLIAVLQGTASKETTNT